MRNVHLLLSQQLAKAIKLDRLSLVSIYLYIADQIAIIMS